MKEIKAIVTSCFGFLASINLSYAQTLNSSLKYVNCNRPFKAFEVDLGSKEVKYHLPIGITYTVENERYIFTDSILRNEFRIESLLTDRSNFRVDYTV